MPYRPTLRQLDYVIALADARHFGKAARRCHVSQPTLSVQIGLVEKNLGVTLFERTPSSVVPTEIGERFATQARLALAVVDDLLDIAATDTRALGGLVRLGTAPTFGPYFLPVFLPAIHRRFPELQIYIHEDRPAALETAVAEGSLDCGLGPKPARDGLLFRRVGFEKLLLGVPAEHPMANRSKVNVRDLQGVRLLALGSGHRLLENVIQLAAASGAIVVDDYQGTSLDSIRQMVSIGMGFSLFPELYARAEFRKDDDVRLLDIEGWSERREVGFYWRASSGRQRHYDTLAREADDAARLLNIAGKGS